jgi:Rha family phage regulatory protein
LFVNTERVATFAVSHFIIGKRKPAKYIFAGIFYALTILSITPVWSINVPTTAFEVCSTTGKDSIITAVTPVWSINVPTTCLLGSETTGKDSRFSVYNAKNVSIMADLVFQNSNGNDVTTSLIVAEVFGKEHSKVMRDIENLSCSESFRVANFGYTPYTHPQNGQVYHYYEMTKDGFSFLVMGYTGSKAGEFKERFINEFNRREALLKDDDYILMRSQQILQKRVENLQAENKRLEQQNALQEEQLRQAAPKVEYCNKVLSSKGYLTVNMIASCIGISDIKLNKLLCQWGIQYKESGVYYLYSKYRDKGYTVHRPHAYTDSLGNIKTRQHMYWTEAGKRFILELYNSKVAA